MVYTAPMGDRQLYQARRICIYVKSNKSNVRSFSILNFVLIEIQTKTIETLILNTRSRNNGCVPLTWRIDFYTNTAQYILRIWNFFLINIIQLVTFFINLLFYNFIWIKTFRYVHVEYWTFCTLLNS